MPLLLTYLMPEAASSFYTSLYVGKDANVISIDLTLVRRKWQSLSVRETGIFWAPLCTRLLCAPDTRRTYQIHLSLDHRAERGRREWSMCSQISLWMLGIVRACTRKRECLVSTFYTRNSSFFVYIYKRNKSKNTHIYIVLVNKMSRIFYTHKPRV